MSKTIHSDAAGNVFDPHKDWEESREFIELPGASRRMIELGVFKAFTELEQSMRAFVHPRCWKYVEYFRVDPKPPIQGKLGWRFRKR